jgi:hypothetical protein
MGLCCAELPSRMVGKFGSEFTTLPSQACSEVGEKAPIWIEISKKVDFIEQI